MCGVAGRSVSLFEPSGPPNRLGALLATAWDYRLDAFGGLAVVVGVSLAKWAGPSWRWADHVAALLVAGTVLWIGGGLLRENVGSLMDRQANPDVLAAVRRAAANVPGVDGVETLRVRKMGLEYQVEIHIEVDPAQDVKTGHAIAHAVKDHLINHVPAIRDVLVHIEPSGAAHPKSTSPGGSPS